jgi:uncharacterized tellurite resistance protein B-like protein
MENNEILTNESILAGHSDVEKAAYLAAVASIATADQQASQEEIDYSTALCETAELPEAQKQTVLNAAMETDGIELKRSLDVLKNSQLKYSLVTDLMSFAKADSDYNEPEQQYVQKIAQYLGVDQHQFSLLDQFAENVAANSPASVQDAAEPSFFSTSGLKEKMQKAGINPSTLIKGLIAIAGPIILSRVLSGRRGSSSGGLGNLGGMFGGSGGGGGLGSLIGMLSGGRGFGSTGGLLDRVLGGRF